MEFNALEKLIAESPILRQFHKKPKSLALVVSFLYKEFKTENRLQIPAAELSRKLALFLTFVNDPDAEELDDLPRDTLFVESEAENRARLMLDKWTNERLLFKDRAVEEYYELSQYAEKLFRWLDELQDVEPFVGAESRFLRIIADLKELVDKSQTDPEARIAELKRQKKAIDEEIAQIKATGQAATLNDTQIKERFQQIRRASNDLTADFKEVETNFRGIFKELQDEDWTGRRGDAIRYATDAAIELKESDQGRSFFAFWDFLTQEKNNAHLQQLVEKAYNLMAERRMTSNDLGLYYLSDRLYFAGKRVVEVNRALIDKLSRMLTVKERENRRLIFSRLREILQTARALAQNPPDDKAFIFLEGKPEMDWIMERPLKEEPNFEGVFEAPDFSQAEAPNLDNLFAANHFELKKLEENIEKLLSENSPISLDSVLNRFPPQNGVSELMGYLHIAARNPRHLIDDSVTDFVFLPAQADSCWALPAIIFNR